VSAEDRGLTANVPSDQVGIYFEGASASSRVSNIELRVCEIYAVGRDAFRIIRADNTNIHDCDIGGINRGSATGYISVAVRAANSINGFTLKNNSIHDIWQYEGDDPPYNNNPSYTGSRCHSGDWMHVYTSNVSEGMTNFVIDGNKFYADHNFAYANGATDIAGFFACAINGLKFRNNLVMHQHAQGLLIGTTDAGAGPTNVEIYNNTFLSQHPTTTSGSGTYVGGGSVVLTSTADSGTWKIYNNIFWMNNTSYHFPIETGSGTYALPAQIDNNLYYKTGSTSVVLWNGTTYTLSGWKTLTGKDSASAFGQATFVNPAATWATSSSGNYALSASDTAAKDQGYNLSSVWSGAADILGTSRPQGSAWDIGAYEYVSGDTTPPSAPAELSVS